MATDMQPTSLKRAGGFLLGLLLVLSLSVSIAPRPTYAFLGLGDIVNDPLNLIKNTISAGSSLISSSGINALDLKEYVLDGAAHLVAQVAITSIVHGVVNWANNGFNGSPAFVANIQVHLGQVSDQTASNFFSQLTGVSLNSPFQAQVASALQTQYYKSTAGNSFFLLNACTLTGTSASAVSANGYDFSKGGLSGWFTFTSQPQNNPYGLYFAAKDELGSRVGSSLTQTQNEIAQNHGFLSWRGDCNFQGVAVPTVSATSVNLTENPDGTYDATDGDTITAGATKDNGTNCLSYDVVTPGSVIENQLEKSLGSGVDSLVSSDEINEVISALAQGLISNVLGGGGLAGTSKPQGGGADYFTQTAAAAADASTTSGVASNLAASISTEQAQLTQYQGNLQTINTAALAAQTATTNAANSASSCTFGEGASASAVLQNVVNPIVDSSNTALANTATSLSTLANLQASLAGSPTTDAVTAAALNYQNFLGASSTPSASDIANGQAQSQDLSNGVTSTTTPAGSTTIETELNNITREANSCTPAS